MSNIKQGIMAFILLMLFANSFYATGWVWPQGYQNAINVTVNNWTYTANYNLGNYIYQEKLAPFVLVTLNNSDYGEYQIKGYSTSDIFVGNITYKQIWINGSRSVILLPNKTDQYNSWYKATIFYNPIPNKRGLFNNSGIYNIVTYPYLNGSKKYFNQTIKLTNYFTPQYNSCSYWSIDPNCNVRSLPYVILTNKSLINEDFNITFYPDEFNLFLIYKFNPIYVLNSVGSYGTGTQLTEYPMVSNTAQLVFNTNQLLDKGYEGYFSDLTSNKIISEGFRVEYPKMYSTTTNALTNTNINSHARLLYFNIDTSNVINILFIPASTTNYTLGNVLTNGNLTIPYQQLFTSKIYVEGLNWTYNFTTQAYPKNIINGSDFNTTYHKFIINNVGYALLTLPHFSGMGADCRNIYLDDYNYTTGYEHGAIPFNLYSCSQSQIQLLFKNRTINGYAFKHFYVYINAPNFLGDYSNVSIRNDFIIYSGNTFNLDGQFGIVTMDSPFNVNSALSSSGSQYAVKFVFTQNATTSRQTIYIPCYGNCGFIGSEPDYTKIIVYNDPLIGGGFVSDRLAVYDFQPSFSGGYLYPWQAISSNYTDKGNIFFAPFTLYTTPYTFTETHFYTSQAHIGLPMGINENWNNTQGSSNTFVTTTINPNLFSNQTIALSFTGYTIPLIIGKIIAIILILLAATLVKENEHYSIILVLIVIWLIGLWQISFLVLGLILTILFIIYEFTMRKG